jgi:hypothetical protein
MPVCTVHEPPLRAAGALAEAERFVFVRDGFYWWAFLLTPFWMLWHQLWLVFLIYAASSAVIDTALRVIGAPASAIALIDILISFLIGLEASTLLRLSLRRRGWQNIGVVSGDDLEDAERRFFDAWVRHGATPGVATGVASSTAPSAPPLPAPPRWPASEASGVIGLFPEPGAQR